MQTREKKDVETRLSIGESGAGWVEGLVGTRFNSSTPEGAATKI